MTDSLWRVCVDCWDWIWPADPVFTDTLGRSPICTTCHARTRRTPADKNTEEEKR